MKSLFKAGGVGPQKKLGDRPSWRVEIKLGALKVVMNYALSAMKSYLTTILS